MKVLRLHEVMRLRGVAPPEALDCAAAQRCERCPSQRLCDEALAAGDARGLSLFCPNSHYMQQVRSASLRFR